MAITPGCKLLLLLLIGHGVQQLLELRLCDLLPQLARLREHDESVLDVGGSLLLDEADAAQSVGRFGVEDLVEDALARVVVLSVSEERHVSMGRWCSENITVCRCCSCCP